MSWLSSKHWSSILKAMNTYGFCDVQVVFFVTLCTLYGRDSIFSGIAAGISRLKFYWSFYILLYTVHVMDGVEASLSLGPEDTMVEKLLLKKFLNNFSDGIPKNATWASYFTWIIYFCSLLMSILYDGNVQFRIM